MWVFHKSLSEGSERRFDVLHKTGSILYVIDYASEHNHQY